SPEGKESTAVRRRLSSRVSQENSTSTGIVCRTIWNLTRRLAPRLMSMIPIAYRTADRERDSRRSHGDPTGAQVLEGARMGGGGGFSRNRWHYRSRAGPAWRDRLYRTSSSRREGQQG